jgi:hypothetical protein
VARRSLTIAVRSTGAGHALDGPLQIVYNSAISESGPRSGCARAGVVQPKEGGGHDRGGRASRSRGIGVVTVPYTTPPAGGR